MMHGGSEQGWRWRAGPRATSLRRAWLRMFTRCVFGAARHRTASHLLDSPPNAFSGRALSRCHSHQQQVARPMQHSQLDRTLARGRPPPCVDRRGSITRQVPPASLTSLFPSLRRLHADTLHHSYRTTTCLSLTHANHDRDRDPAAWSIVLFLVSSRLQPTQLARNYPSIL